MTKTHFDRNRHHHLIGDANKTTTNATLNTARAQRSTRNKHTHSNYLVVKCAAALRWFNYDFRFAGSFLPYGGCVALHVARHTINVKAVNVFSMVYVVNMGYHIDH